MRVLVTGGLGFIGSHLVDRLVAGKDKVTVLDDCSSNAISVAQSKAQEVLVGKVRDGVPGSYDEVYHLASIVGPVGVLHRRGSIVHDMVLDTVAVLERCRGSHLLYVSTSEIYGGYGLCDESMPGSIHIEALSPRVEYAAGKLASEAIVLSSDVRAVIVRPFNVVGPRQKTDGGFVLPRFVQQAVAGQALTVYGDGSAIRAFTHVSDIVDGIMLAMRKGRDKTAYNVGNENNRTTILELAELVIAQVGKGAIKFCDPKDLWGNYFAEAGNKYPDARLAREELGWEPKWSLNRIVEDVLHD